MTKEKLVSLTRYLTDLTNRLTSPIPIKHKTRPNQYKLFLQREIEVVQKKLDAVKLEGVSK